MLAVQDVDLTPNPQALKFILSEKLLQRETRNFANKDEAVNDPLAKGIFEINGVVSVFYMDRFVTIEKDPKASWGEIQKPFVQFIGGFDKNLIPAEAEPKQSSSEEETELLGCSLPSLILQQTSRKTRDLEAQHLWHLRAQEFQEISKLPEVQGTN